MMTVIPIVSASLIRIRKDLVGLTVIILNRLGTSILVLLLILRIDLLTLMRVRIHHFSLYSLFPLIGCIIGVLKPCVYVITGFTDTVKGLWLLSHSLLIVIGLYFFPLVLVFKPSDTFIRDLITLS